jgi:hypothetical protein
MTFCESLPWDQMASETSTTAANGERTAPPPRPPSPCYSFSAALETLAAAARLTAAPAAAGGAGAGRALPWLPPGRAPPSPRGADGGGTSTKRRVRALCAVPADADGGEAGGAAEGAAAGPAAAAACGAPLPVKRTRSADGAAKASRFRGAPAGPGKGEDRLTLTFDL